MDLENLRSLFAVVEHGSFQAAAAARGEPRTKLRRQVDALEAEVGLPLLHRDARGVRLTVAGEHVVQRGGALLRDADALLEGARIGLDGAVGTLRLVVPVGTPDVPRVAALLNLQSLHPGLTLDVTEAEDPLSLVHQPFDYIVHFGERPRLDSSHSRVVLRVPVVPMASAAYLERHGTPTSVAELHQHRLMTWRVEPWGGACWPRVDGGLEPITPHLVSANARLLARTAHEGGGIALVPRAVCFFEPGVELLPVLDGLLGGVTTIRLLSRQSSRSEPRLRALFENIDRLASRLGPNIG